MAAPKTPRKAPPKATPSARGDYPATQLRRLLAAVFPSHGRGPRTPDAAVKEIRRLIATQRFLWQALDAADLLALRVSAAGATSSTAEADALRRAENAYRLRRTKVAKTEEVTVDLSAATIRELDPFPSGVQVLCRHDAPGPAFNVFMDVGALWRILDAWERKNADWARDGLHGWAREARPGAKTPGKAE